MVKQKINYLYDFGIIDHWEGWINLLNKKDVWDSGLISGLTSIPLTIVSFNYLASFFAIIGDRFEEVRNNTEYYIKIVDRYEPLNEYAEPIYLLGVKFDNNGTTLIGSSHNLSLRLIDDICKNDPATETDLVELIKQPGTIV